ncbi:MAG: CbtA family protein [Candidatus Nitrosocaldus sp.]|nr:CbtA family protein [Candidatus Nitrosocaldus sp.]MDW8275092.1 CbtA family protein [Candidatus Nitrosocaldus sp.]
MILNIIAVALLAGVVGGALYGLMNLALVTPYIDRAVEIEASRLGESVDIAFRVWQKQGAILAGLIAGVAYSSLFSIVYAYMASRSSSSSTTTRTTISSGIILALIIWVVLYLMPALKYPANPPAVGDPETIYYRQGIYIAYMLISGIAALALALLRMRLVGVLSRNIAMIAAYAVIMLGAYMLMPPNPDAIDMAEDILTGFRVTSAATSLALWLMIGFMTSLLWSRTGLIRRRMPTT